MDPSAAMERFLHEPRLERKTERSTRRKLLHRLLDWQCADFIGCCPLVSSSVHQDVRQYPARWSTGHVETGGALVGLVLPSQGRTKQKAKIDIGERPAQDQTDLQGASFLRYLLENSSFQFNSFIFVRVFGCAPPLATFQFCIFFVVLEPFQFAFFF